MPDHMTLLWAALIVGCVVLGRLILDNGWTWGQRLILSLRRRWQVMDEEMVRQFLKALVWQAKAPESLAGSLWADYTEGRLRFQWRRGRRM